MQFTGPRLSKVVNAMRLIFLLLFALVLALPLTTNAQDVLGNVYLGVPTALPINLQSVCLPPVGYAYVFATSPLEPVKAVRFQITWPGGVDHDQGSVIEQGAVDVSEPGDDVWKIQFEQCLDHPTTLWLVVYGGVDFHGSRGWMCAYGDEVPKPVWTLCSGGTIEGELFDVGPDWMDALPMESTTVQ